MDVIVKGVSSTINQNQIDEMEEMEKEVFKRKRQLYTLTFDYTFKYENDVVFFAHFTPYTFTDL